jgi:hypothetical protein
MLGVMYTINNVPRSRSGVTLTCNQCSYSLPVNKFDDRLGSRRTQAARAMLEHLRNEHGKEPIGKRLPQTMGTMVLSQCEGSTQREPALGPLLRTMSSRPG